MKKLLFLLLTACGTSESSVPPAEAGADAVVLPAFECCVDGRSCTTGERIRWCAPPDAGPAGERCLLSTLQGCYMRASDVGVEEVFKTNTLAPESTRPDGISECTSEVRGSYDAPGSCP